MLHYRTGSRFFSYISIDGTKIPCTYFPNQNLAQAMEKTGYAALCYQETFRLFYCGFGPLKGCFVFFFYNPAFNGDIPVSCLAASPADTANFLHEFYSDYHAPMIQQVDITRMKEPGYKIHVKSVAEDMITSILSLKLEEVTVGKGVLDVRKIPSPLMKYLDSLHPFYVTFSKQNPAVRRRMKNGQYASYAGHYIRVDAHTKAAVEEYLLENSLYDDADCIIDEAMYCRIRDGKKMKQETRKALKDYPDIKKIAPAAHIIHERPIFHVEETGAYENPEAEYEDYLKKKIESYKVLGLDASALEDRYRHIIKNGEPVKAVVFDYHALDEKASRFQAMLKLPEKERKEALFTAVGQRERLF